MPNLNLTCTELYTPQNLTHRQFFQTRSGCFRLVCYSLTKDFYARTINLCDGWLFACFFSSQKKSATRHNYGDSKSSGEWREEDTHNVQSQPKFRSATEISKCSKKRRFHNWGIQYLEDNWERPSRYRGLQHMSPSPGGDSLGRKIKQGCTRISRFSPEISPNIMILIFWSGMYDSFLLKLFYYRIFHGRSQEDCSLMIEIRV